MCYSTYQGKPFDITEQNSIYSYFESWKSKDAYNICYYATSDNFSVIDKTLHLILKEGAWRNAHGVLALPFKGRWFDPPLTQSSNDTINRGPVSVILLLAGH